MSTQAAAPPAAKKPAKKKFHRKAPAANHGGQNLTNGAVPNLRRNPNGNLEAFQKAMTPYAESKFTLAGRCFRDGVYPISAEDPHYTTDEDTATPQEKELHKMRHGHAVSHHLKQVQKQDEEAVALFAVLESCLSPDSADLVKNHPDWAALVPRRCPLGLMVIIVETHRQGNYGIESFDIDAAINRYQLLKMSNAEQLSAYSERFQDAVKDLIAVGGTAPSTNEQLIRFLKSLPTFYDPVVKYIINRRREEGDDSGFPTTFGEMTRRINQIGESLSVDLRPKYSSTNGTASNVAFHAKSDQKKNSNGKKSANANDNKTIKRSCALCDGDDHWANACPSLTVAKAAVQAANHSTRVTINGEEICLSMRTLVNDTMEVYILLDNQSTLHLFCDSILLDNISTVDTRVTVSGVGNGRVVTDQAGNFGVINNVYYHSKAGANVLSFSLLRSTPGWALHYDMPGDAFVACNEEHGSTMTFSRKDFGSGGSLYAHTIILRPQRVLTVATVEENKKLFTKAELEQAERARTAMANLAYPSEASLKRLLLGGGLINSNVTVRGLEVARQVYGPHLALIKGGTVRRKPTIYSDVPISAPISVRSTQELHFDIMLVGTTEKFLISVSKPLGLAMSNFLKTKDINAITKELIAQINGYKSRQFTISTAFCDSEATLTAQIPALNGVGIHLEVSSPGTHAVVVERKIGLIRVGMRKILGMLPYKLPKSLYKWLVAYVIRWMNAFPSPSGQLLVSPRELFSGRKVDYKRDAPAEFGAYAQVFVPTAGKMEPRTEAGIVMLPTSNRQGGIHFYLVTSGMVLVRNQYNLLPLPIELVEEINARAAKESGVSVDTRRVTPDVLLERTHGNHVVISDDMVPERFEVVAPVTSDPTHEVVPIPAADEPVYQPEPYPDPPVLLPVPPVENQGTTDDPVDPIEPDDLPDEGTDPTSNDDSLPLGPVVSIVDPVPAVESTTDVITGRGRKSKQNSLFKDIEIKGRPNRHNVRVAMHAFFSQAKEHHSRLTRVAEALFIRDNFCFRLTVKKALQAYGVAATSAICKELSQLLRIPAFVPVKKNTVPTKKQLIRSMMFLKEKVKPDGSFDKLKARLVARGDMQSFLDDDDKSSPTVATTAALAVAAIAAREERDVATLDVTGAFLQAPMNTQDIFVVIEREIVDLLVQVAPVYRDFIDDPGGTITVKLVRALYGCKQSALLWYYYMVNKLKDIGFVPNPSEPCVLNRGDVAAGTQQTIAVHVDDFLITTQKNASMDHLLEELKVAFIDVTVHREKILSYLGMNFDFSTPGKVKICMLGYLEEFLKDNAHVEGIASSPASNKLFDVDDASQALTPDQAKLFHTSVARLLYLSKRTRPDILLPVNFLCTRVTCPTEDDNRKLERLIKYLNGTRELGICLQPEANAPVTVDGYVDASYATHNDAKGHTGIYVAIGQGPIFVRSSKQKLVAKSSTEAELIALSDATSQVIWCREFLIAQGYSIGPAKVYQDNKSTIQLAEKGRSTSDRTKHISVRYFFIHDRIDSQEIVLEYLPTEDMVADILTKPLQGALFLKLRDMLLNWTVVAFDAVASRDHVENMHAG